MAKTANGPTWGRLDHAAKLFPAVSGELNTSTFRVSAYLAQPVDPERLQRAVDSAIGRYSMFAVRLGQGIFWNFFTKNLKRLVVQQESTYPCSSIMPKENNGYLLRVLYFGSRISVEFFHALTDGTGGSEFLKTVLYSYLTAEEGVEITDEGVITPTSLPYLGEAADSFSDYYRHFRESRTDTLEAESLPARHLSGTSFEPFGHNVIQAQVSVATLKAAAKRHGTTLTVLLMAITLKALFLTDPRPSTKPFAVCLPVNLRGVFPSKTLKNFFTVVNIGYERDPSQEIATLVAEVHEETARKLSKEYLTQVLLDSMRFEKSITSRITPSPLKTLAIRYGFDRFGETYKTVSLSNLGTLDIPESMRPHVTGADFLLYPTVKSPINISLASYEGTLTISFVRSIAEVDFIRGFLDLLGAETGDEIALTSNEWGV